VVLSFADAPAVVLGPLRGRSDVEWRRAPAGKWTPAQIVEHLALAFELSARGFAERRSRPPMTRRPRTALEWAATWLIFGPGWVPAVRAPARSTPAADPDPRAAERHFLQGHADLLALERELLPARAADLFVKHPRMGDLTLAEWLRFHAWHCDHHARQIRARLAA
jgi:hypothetical protein